MKRALIERSNAIKDLPLNYTKSLPVLLQSNTVFKDSKLAKSHKEDLIDNDNDEDNLKASSNCKLIFFFNRLS